MIALDKNKSSIQSTMFDFDALCINPIVYTILKKVLLRKISA